MVTSVKEKKKKTRDLIKKVSDYYGGDSASELEEYCRERLAFYRDNLDELMECFSALELEISHLPRRVLHGTRKDPMGSEEQKI